MKKEGIDFLEDCLKKKQINKEDFSILKYDLDLLEQSLDKLNISANLEMARDDFNRL